MTPERKLIEAVLEAVVHDAGSTDAILATPAVQTALAEVRGAPHDPDDAMIEAGEELIAEKRSFGCRAYAGEIYEAMVSAATLKHEPVLRWKGDKLWLGKENVARIVEVYDDSWSFWLLVSSNVRGRCPTEAEARTAAEQAVRDWLKRAGCV